MKSATVPSSFWHAYRSLDGKVQSSVKKAYRLWHEDPFHPSQRFKCVNQEENIWSVRLSLGYRALGIMEGDTVTWFWAGGHDDYERFFG